MPKATKPKTETLPFKAAGGKAWLVAARLETLWKKNNNSGHRRLFDPFVGGGAFPFTVNPSACLVADANPYLIYSYLWIKNGATRRIPYEHSESAYYELRDRFNTLRCIADQEWLGEAFFLLNRTSHRGLWRVNNSQAYNTPWGYYKQFPDINLKHFTDRLAHWTILNSGYLATINEHLQDDDFLFLDPPYDGTFDHYTKDRFGWADQELLAAIAAGHPGPVVICNSATDRIIQLYEKSGLTVEVIEKSGQCIQAGKPGAKTAPEVFAYRNV